MHLFQVDLYTNGRPYKISFYEVLAVDKDAARAWANHMAIQMGLDLQTGPYVSWLGPEKKEG